MLKEQREGRKAKKQVLVFKILDKIMLMKQSLLWLLLFLMFPPLSVCWAGGPKRTSTPEGEFLLYSNGRSELVISQTALGAFLGTILGDAVDRKTRGCASDDEYCNDNNGSRAAAGLLLGAGAGLGASLLLSRDGYFDTGRAMVINLAGEWGITNGFLLSAVTEMDAASNFELMAFSTGLGSILGSAILTRNKSYPSGDLGLVKSGALWGSLIPLGIYLSMAEDFDGKTAAWTVLGGGNLGLLSMAFIAPQLEWSRKRSIWLDIGGWIGGTSGFALGALLSPDSGRAMAAGGVLGSIIGISATVLLTQNGSPTKKLDEAQAPASSLFWKDGSHWGLGFPLPQLTPKRTGDKTEVETQLSLISIKW